MKQKARAELSHLPEEKRPVGRPRLALDPEMIHRLAWIQCTNEEIAAVMKCSVDTLVANFSEPLKAGRLMGKSSLRRHQWRAAQRGNPALLIWLGKQLLGQRDDPLPESDPNAKPAPIGVNVVPFKGDDPANGEHTPAN